jgi:hypothetical protein
MAIAARFEGRIIVLAALCDFEKDSTRMQIANLCRCLLALCLVSDAFGSGFMKRAWYNDITCSTPELTTFPTNVPNPLTFPFNDCVKYFDNGFGNIGYQKVTACSGATVQVTHYDDAICTILAAAPFGGVSNPETQNVGACTCVTGVANPGCSYYMITCGTTSSTVSSPFFPKAAAASAVPVALFVVFAALISLGI